MNSQPAPGTSRVSRTSSARSVVRTLARTNVLLLKQLWIWPIIAGVLLGAIGLVMRNAVEKTLQEDLRADLQAILETDVTALRVWLKSQEQVAAGVARDVQLREQVRALIRLAEQPESSKNVLTASAELPRLRAELEPVLEGHGMNGFIVLNRERKVIACERDDAVGLTTTDEESKATVESVLAGKTGVSRPLKSRIILPDRHGQMRAGVPTMFAFAPVKADDGTVIAALGLRLRPDDEFSQILQVARAGTTGETYAFDRNGLLLSESRFDEQLREIGLLTEDADSVLNVSLRNPGVDLVAGERTKTPRSEQPLTALAAGAIEGASGSNTVGYRDYRGVQSVGAWTWLDDYEFGVGTEIDADDAFRAMRIIRTTFWSMFAMLGAASAAIFGFSIVNARLNREARRAALDAKQLGQYTLDEKLGEGGMGVVYHGHHALLLRPTAIKFLHPEKTNDQTVARFEREVKLTSQLVHPNTIAVYDYGRTPEGIFYYAMEYLDGLNLEDLIKQYGPQSDGRTAHILRQICGSLAEAHGIGLIHRDIKPANIMLSLRGGVPDFVKVLDFGLVKALDAQQQSNLTSAGGMTGTPLYLSPEAIRTPEDVDARSDIYAIGAVGYFLLTGRPVFEGANVLEIVRQHAETPPVPPSEQCGRPVNPELERVLLRCLAKQPGDRPQTAQELDELLQASCGGLWVRADALHWWQDLKNRSSAQGLASTGWDAGATIVAGR